MSTPYTGQWIAPEYASDYKNRFLDVHALRHTYNTPMRDLIEDEKLRAFTGHRSVKMSENYDHKEMIERLPRFAELRESVDQFPI